MLQHRLTREVERSFDTILSLKANVCKALLAQPHAANVSTRVEHLLYDVLANKLRQTSDKHCTTAIGTLSSCGGWCIYVKRKIIL
jgi:hypothetical protein